MAKFKVLRGSHQDNDGRTYSKGDIVSTNIPLDEVFTKQKFQRLESSEEKPKKKVVKKEPEVDHTPEGKDVTEEYPLAVANDLKVYRNKRWHYVYDLGDFETPLNEKALTEEKVNEFLNSQLQ